MRRAEAFIDELGTAFIIGGISVGAVGFLAALTAPMPLGLLGYHVYLIWAGMTTNETGKWADLKDDMKDGFVWVCEVDPPADDVDASDNGVNVRAKKIMIAFRTDNGMPPDSSGKWRRCWKLREVENVYDLGFWENLKEVLTN
jgi:palmitoyltransferase